MGDPKTSDIKRKIIHQFKFKFNVDHTLSHTYVFKKGEKTMQETDGGIVAGGKLIIILEPLSFH